jgi:DivIVA domain-containing protein
MATLLLVLVVVLVIAGLVYGVVSLLSGEDPGLAPVDPDGYARPLPHDRSLHEPDLKAVRFDVAMRGYRMAQVDRVLRRTAYDLGYKDEMIAVLEAEVAALRDGRLDDAELLRKARQDATTPEEPTDDLSEGSQVVDEEAASGIDPDQAEPDQAEPDQAEPEQAEPEQVIEHRVDLGAQDAVVAAANPSKRRRRSGTIVDEPAVPGTA